MEKNGSTINRSDLNRISGCELVYNVDYNYLYHTTDHALSFLWLTVTNDSGSRCVVIPVTAKNMEHFMAVLGFTNHFGQDADSSDNQNILRKAIGKTIVCRFNDTGETIIGSPYTGEYDFNPSDGLDRS